MKRKGMFTGAIALLTVICVIAVTGISVQADSRDIKSRGNFVLGSGEMSIHASDIDYLQAEVQTLYSELPSILEINASGTGTARRDNLHSKGIINYKNGAAILDSSDLTLLSDEIDNLESEYKANTVASLNDINTYFKIDSSVTHDQGEALSSTYANNLSLDGICNGILWSQSVDHLQATPIIADNLTAGTAAWVNGTCIIGNGADNEKAYKRGIEDGKEGDEPKNLYPIYGVQEATVEIKHVHLGSPENKDGTSGCYQNSHTTKVEEHRCSKQLYQTEVTLYPDGTWHGGYYTCENHDGVYESPGQCPHVDKETVTTWKHDIVCGLTDMLYAKLTVRGTDTDYFDRAIRLEAVLEKGEGYDNLKWQESDEFVWEDVDGNVLGSGTGIMVHDAGVYRCGINVTNEDIEGKDIEVTVKIESEIIIIREKVKE